MNIDLENKRNQRMYENKRNQQMYVPIRHMARLRSSIHRELAKITRESTGSPESVSLAAKEAAILFDVLKDIEFLENKYDLYLAIR